jgi:hypothetical protein
MNPLDTVVSHLTHWVLRRPHYNGALGLASSRRQDADAPFYSSPPALALWWVKQQELVTGGIRWHSVNPQAGPGVTGGLIPTLMEYGEKVNSFHLPQPVKNSIFGENACRLLEKTIL